MPYRPNETEYSIMPARAPDAVPVVWVNMSKPPPLGHVLMPAELMSAFDKISWQGLPPAVAAGCAVLLHFSHNNRELSIQLAERFYFEVLAKQRVHAVLKISGAMLYRWIVEKTLEKPIIVEGAGPELRTLDGVLTDEEKKELRRAHDAVADLMKEKGAGRD